MKKKYCAHYGTVMVSMYFSTHISAIASLLAIWLVCKRFEFKFPVFIVLLSFSYTNYLCSFMFCSLTLYRYHLPVDMNEIDNSTSVEKNKK